MEVTHVWDLHPSNARRLMGDSVTGLALYGPVDSRRKGLEEKRWTVAHQGRVLVQCETRAEGEAMFDEIREGMTG